jgi:hypothetical protein
LGPFIISLWLPFTLVAKQKKHAIQGMFSWHDSVEPQTPSTVAAKLLSFPYFSLFFATILDLLQVNLK